MRMNKLAAQAILTPSGRTRVIERLTRRGLVERTRWEIDGQGQKACEPGSAALARTGPHHLRWAGPKGATALRYRSPDKTLTDDEVNTLHSTIVERLGKAFGAALRA